MPVLDCQMFLSAALVNFRLNMPRLRAFTCLVQCCLVIILLTAVVGCGGGSSSQTASPSPSPSSSSSPASPTLAASHVCPENTVYCREALKVIVVGFNNGLLYGWLYAHAGDSCPESGLPPNNSTVFCFYTTATFSPENWTFQGQTQQVNATDPRGNVLTDSPIEIQFGPDACPYKYVYTWARRILRATSALTDWNFVNLVQSSPANGLTGLPDLPADTSGRLGIFAIGTHNSAPRLFYGNYNGHVSNPPHAYVWHSDDCGDTWPAPYEFVVASATGTGHGREIHAIEVDPVNPSSIYVNVDTEDADPDVQGLWRSLDGGDTYVKTYPGTFLIGINFVFPPGVNKIFLEGDGSGAEAGGGPLLEWDEVSGDQLQVAAPWPQTGAAPAWAGNGSAIKVTSQGNIFVVSNGQKGAFSFRSGIWYLAPPDYNTAALLEDLAPPIQSVVDNGDGSATATTFGPLGIQPGDALTICVPNQQSLNAGGVVPSVNAPNTFTYDIQGSPPCPTNLPAEQTAFAQKDKVFLGFRTLEIKDPTNGMTYLYNGWQKINEPPFHASSGNSQ